MLDAFQLFDNPGGFPGEWGCTKTRYRWYGVTLANHNFAAIKYMRRSPGAIWPDPRANPDFGPPSVNPASN